MRATRPSRATERHGRRRPLPRGCGRGRGSPRRSLSNYFADPAQQFFAGRGSSTPGTWRVRYTESELCVMTAGSVIIKSDGISLTFSPGDAFGIPAGLSGTWTVIESCTKIYAMFESRT